MSRRNLLKKHQVFTNLNSASGGLSSFTDVSGLDKITYYMDVASGVRGEVKVTVINDERVNLGSPGSMILNFQQTLTINGSTDPEYLITIENSGFKWMALDFIPAASTGNINAWISGTTVGA